MRSRRRAWVTGLCGVAAAVLMQCGTETTGPDGEDLAAPASVSVSPGDGHVLVSWTAVSGATSYNVYYMAGATVSKASGSRVNTPQSPYDLTGLVNGTQYAIAVSAVAGGVESGLSAVVTTTPVATGGVPSAPSGVAAAPGNGSVTVSWSPSTGATSYNLYYAPGTSVSLTTGTKRAGVSSPYTVSSLVNGTQYAFVVTAVNGAGESAPSAVATATPVEGGVEALVLTPGDRQMTLSWTNDPLATSYTVYWVQGNNVTKAAPNKVERVTVPYVATGLINMQLYTFGVTKVTGSVESDFIAVGSGRPVPEIPEPPTIAAVAGDGRITVYFDTVSWAEYYHVYYTTAGTVTTQSPRQRADGPGLVITGLTNGVTYSVAVSAVNGLGESAFDSTWRVTPWAQAPSSMGMVLLPGGTFQMGSTTGYSDEQPVHSVTVSGFWMDSTEVTQASYVAVMGVNPSYFTGDTRRPVEQVTWFDAVLYCNARSKREGLDTVYRYTSVSGTPGNGCSGLGNLVIDYTKNGYRLPTEAEWEYACRAGTTTSYYWGEATDAATVGRYAWYYNNSGDATHPVATKLPNAFGLYDMSGSVWEWCNDWYGSYTAGAQTDPTGPADGTYRVLRGGSWRDNLEYLRSSFRSGSDPDSWYDLIGFRCVRRR